MKTIKRIVNAKKSLKNKWTAVTRTIKEKHFILVKVVITKLANDSIESIEFETIHSKHTQLVAWGQLNDEFVWKPSWV